MSLVGRMLIRWSCHLLFVSGARNINDSWNSLMNTPKDEKILIIATIQLGSIVFYLAQVSHSKPDDSDVRREQRGHGAAERVQYSHPPMQRGKLRVLITHAEIMRYTDKDAMNGKHRPILAKKIKRAERAVSAKTTMRYSTVCLNQINATS